MTVAVCTRLNSQQLQIVRHAIEGAASILHALTTGQEWSGADFKLSCNRNGTVLALHCSQRRFVLEWERTQAAANLAKSPTTVKLNVRRLNGECVFAATHDPSGWLYDVGWLSPLTLAQLWQDLAAPHQFGSNAQPRQPCSEDVSAWLTQELSHAKQQQRGVTVMQTLLRVAGWSMAAHSGETALLTDLSPRLTDYVNTAQLRHFSGWSGLGEFRQIEIDNFILEYRPADGYFAVRERLPLYPTDGCRRRLLCCARRDRTGAWHVSPDSLLLQADMTRIRPLLALKFPPAPPQVFT